MTTFADPTALAALRGALQGRTIVPGDPDYDQARAVFAGGFDQHPAVIVRVANAADVSRVIGFARETGLPLAVRSGGHSNAGHSSVEGGVVLDLHDMRALEIDPAAHTAWAETGLTAIEVTRAVGEHGLAVGFGDTGSVGIGGITLGGGVGYLVRKYGLTIDDLLAAEVVTADGQKLHVDAQHHPDLFWAIRGGGGNFGIATRFQFRLHTVPSIVGGMLMLPGTPEVIANFMTLAADAPEELSTIANIMPAPPMPFVSEEQHGQIVIFAMLCYAGETEAGQRAIAPFRALATPLADFVHPSPYHEMYPPDDPDYHPLAIARTLFMDRVDLSVAQEIVKHLEASDAPIRVVQLRPLGGAMARVPAQDTAFAHRQSRIMANVASFYSGPEDKSQREAWVAGLVSALRQDDAGAYVNFLVDEGEDRIRAAYPGPTWDRLRAIKRQYDPENLFRINQNIPPA
jgi:hypothetical protein